MEYEDTVEVVSAQPNFFALPSTPQLSESLTAKLHACCVRLAKHRKCTVVVEICAKKMLKIMAAVPELEPATISSEESQRQLVSLFGELIRVAEGTPLAASGEHPGLTANDLFAFYNYNERKLVFKTESGLQQLNLAQFVGILSEFVRFLEHLFALEGWQKLDLSLGAETKLPPLLPGIKFKGLSMGMYWKIRAVAQRVRDIQGETAFRETLQRFDLLDHFEENFGYKWLRKLVATIPEAKDRVGLLFSWVSSFDLTSPLADQPPADIKVYHSHPLFNPEATFKRIEGRERPPSEMFEGLPPALADPSDKGQASLALLLASGLLRSADFLAHINKLMHMYLRLSTGPILPDRDTLTIYSPIYPLKRLQLINLKKANSRLLYQLVRSQPTDSYNVKIEHLGLRITFRDFLTSYFKTAYYREESELARLPEELRRRQRRYNRIFERGFSLVIDKLLQHYTGFYFDNAVRLTYLSKAMRASQTVNEALSVLPLWKTLKLSETQSKDPNLSWYDRWNAIVAEINTKTEPKTVVFTFWKGLKLYERHEGVIQKVNYESKTLDLSCDTQMTGYVSDFEPMSIVVVANCPEAYFLLNKMTSYGQFCEPDKRKGQGRDPLIPYFIHSPLLQTLALRWDGVGKWTSGAVYNCYLQNPLLTFLSLFRGDLKGPGLFASHKLDLAQESSRLMLKLVVLESFFEKGVSMGDIFASPFAAQVLQLIGLDQPKESLLQTWEARKVDAACGVLKYNLLSRKTWYYFNDVNACDSSLVLFRKTPESDVRMGQLKARVALLKTDKLLELSRAVTLTLDPSSGTRDLTSEQSMLTHLNPSCDYLTNALYIRRILSEDRLFLSRKIDTLYNRMRTPEYQMKVLHRLFRDTPYLKELSIATMRVTEINNKFVLGQVGLFFHGSLFINDIGNNAFKENEPNLAGYFSVNEQLTVVVKRVHPDLLRLDVSLATRDISRIFTYVDRTGVLERFGLRKGQSFTVDPKRDIPLVAEFDKVERNFDYFVHETVYMKNWSLTEAKTTLRGAHTDGWAFKPSQRGKSAYLDLVMYFQKIDTIFQAPVFQMVFNVSDTLVLNERPTKYETADLEQFYFRAMDETFQGFSSLVTSWVEPLQRHVLTVLGHPRFTTLPQDQIKAKIESAEGVVAENTPGAANYLVARNPAEDFQFLVFYRDNKLTFGHKV